MELSFVVVADSKKNETRNGWLKEVSYLATAGFKGAELAIRDPAAIDKARLEKTVKATSISIAAIGTGLAYLEEGLSLSAEDPRVRKAAVRRVKRHIAFAKEFKSQVIIGLIRGRDHGSFKKGYKSLVDSITELHDFSIKAGVGLVLEPINRYETSFLNNACQCLEFIDKTKNTGLRILFDTFHANIEERDPLGSIDRIGRLLSHVHFADSNRFCPGRGHIDFSSVINCLKINGYKGFISGEVTLRPDFKTTVREFKRNIRGYL